MWDLPGCSVYNNCPNLSDKSDPKNTVRVFAANNAYLQFPNEEGHNRANLEWCRNELRLYGVPLAFVRDLAAYGRFAQTRLAVRKSDGTFVATSERYRLVELCVPIFWRFNGKTYKMMVFRGCRDARYIRSEIANALHVRPEEVEIRDLMDDILHAFGHDVPGELLPGIGDEGKNPIIVNLDMQNPGSVAKVAFEAGLFGNRPAEFDMTKLRDQNTPQLERLLTAVSYLRAAWAKLPAFVMHDQRERIIAFGDIHANANVLPQIDKIMKDNPDAFFVFTGDYVDRCAPPQPDGKPGKASNPEVIIQMALWQQEFEGRIIFLRGNHETRDVNVVGGLQGQLHKVFGYGTGGVVWEACNAAFNELPIAACIGDCFACHGAVPGGNDPDNPFENIPDLNTLDKTCAEDRTTGERAGCYEGNFLWSDIPFDAIGRSYQFNRRGAGFKIHPETETGILEVLKYDEKPLMPKVLIKGHMHPDGGKSYDGQYSNGDPVTMTCVIGSYPEKLRFGYTIIEPDRPVRHVEWDATRVP
ncbi:MAG: serine/threonine protein phosphatase [Oscillospiraceae bacterium]|nr:serine/threonine protein phosphatase [Oscillospiraceae bacterium]